MKVTYKTALIYTLSRYLDGKASFTDCLSLWLFCVLSAVLITLTMAVAAIGFVLASPLILYRAIRPKKPVVDA